MHIHECGARTNRATGTSRRARRDRRAIDDDRRRSSGGRQYPPARSRSTTLAKDAAAAVAPPRQRSLACVEGVLHSRRSLDPSAAVTQGHRTQCADQSGAPGLQTNPRQPHTISLRSAPSLIACVRNGIVATPPLRNQRATRSSQVRCREINMSATIPNQRPVCSRWPTSGGSNWSRKIYCYGVAVQRRVLRSAGIVPIDADVVGRPCVGICNLRDIAYSFGCAAQW